MEKSFVAEIDDYMSKPLNLKEMTLRINALLRRAKIASGKQLKFKNSELDYVALSLKIGGEAVELAPEEFYLFFYFSQTWVKFSLVLKSCRRSRIATSRKLENCTDFEIAVVCGTSYKGEIYKYGGRAREKRK
jgi:two component transcriptional regulator, winged helix family